jgi:hypothetical protein
MANITKVYLLSVPLEDDYKDTLYFANATAQHNYFAGQVVKSYTDFSYQRKDNVIRVPAQVDTIRNCNYVMYQNSAYSNKWFYAFINRMVYIDDGRTDIYISTDVLQTWMFDMIIKDSFIEREHVNDDTFGLHTIPESLETGEYVCNDIVEQVYGECDWTKSGMMVVFQVSTVKLEKDNYSAIPSNPPTYNTTNGIPNGCYYIGVEFLQSELGFVRTLIGTYDSVGKGDAILSIFLCPKNVVSWYKTSGTGIWNSGNGYYFPNDSVSVFQFGQAQVPMNTTLDGYRPHNNKCFTSPFNYIYATNNCGMDIQYRYEDFRGTPVFTTRGILEQGGGIKCSPDNSKVSQYWNGSVMRGDGWNEGLNGAKFPQLSWTSDYYLNWEAVNGKNIEVQTTLSAIGFAGDVLTGGLLPSAHQNAQMRDTAVQRGRYPDEEPMVPVSGSGMLGSITNFASGIANTMQQIKSAKMVPAQAKGNTTGGYLQFSSDMFKFSFRKMSVRAEFAKAIDSWFDMFGYKVNRLGKPLKAHRQNWWYTKTIGVNIDGNIPNEDMQIIKSIYNNGVTFWRNPANIKDYSVSNNIV